MKKEPQTAIRVSKDTLAKIKEMAQADNRSATNWLETLIIREYKNFKGEMKMSTFKNLTNMIGEEFDVDEIICAFEEDGDVIVKDSENNGYDKIAYINEKNSEQYLFLVDNDNIITKVWSIK